jgi:four helix bundle protein
VSKLNDAEGEAAESQVWALIAARCGYIKETLTEEIFEEYEHLSAQLARMIERPEDGCLLPSPRRRVAASPRRSQNT